MIFMKSALLQGSPGAEARDVVRPTERKDRIA